jgi:hypothetical protein
MKPRVLGVLCVLAVVAGGCASLACRPQTVVVERKEERVHLDSEFRGLKQEGPGRPTEIRRDRIVPEYWIRDRDGVWHQVPEAAWRAAEPGTSLELCR